MNQELRNAFFGRPYVGGNPTRAERLAWAFRYWREMPRLSAGERPVKRFPRTAADALEQARRDVKVGHIRYPLPTTGRGVTRGWNRECNGGRWVEDLKAAGLRFVGYADELAALRHTGWYTEDGGMSGESLRGVVLQLPGKGRRARYVAAYADPCNDGAYRVDVSRRALFEGEEGAEGARYDAGARDAAMAADAFAEVNAERERDYNRAWQAGQEWATAGEEVKRARGELLAILAERRQVAGVTAPTLCEVIRDKVASLLSEIREARKQREKLAQEQWPQYYAAFNEGAGERVIASA